MYNSIWFHFLSKISLQYVWKYFTKRNPTFTRVICYFFRFLRFNDKLFDKYKKVLLDLKKPTKESSSSSSGTDIIIITCVLGNLNLEVHKNQLKLFPSTILPLWRSEKNRRKELCFLKSPKMLYHFLPDILAVLTYISDLANLGLHYNEVRIVRLRCLQIFE